MRTELLPGEKVNCIARRHCIVLLPSLLFLLAVAALYKFGPQYIPMQYNPVQLVAFAKLGLFIASAFFIYKFIDFKTDIWVVTDRRIIDEWGVLSRQEDITPLNRINNVQYRQSLIGLILGFGTVRILTAAEAFPSEHHDSSHGGITVIAFASSPKELKNIILRAQQETTQEGKG
jgi:uncharacterized membrane protein YdbT with pleckstrin-like domain